MKLTRREAILLSHLPNQSDMAIIGILIGKGYHKGEADELLSDNTGLLLWQKTGKTLKGLLEDKTGEQVYGIEPLT